MGIESIIVWLIVGAIAGWLAGLIGEVGVERLHQRQIFAQGHRDLRVAQRCEELQKHGIQIARRTVNVKGFCPAGRPRPAGFFN